MKNNRDNLKTIAVIRTEKQSFITNGVKLIYTNRIIH